MKKKRIYQIESDERKLEEIVNDRLKKNLYLYFGQDARIIKRHKGELVISTEKGETVVMSRSFESLLLAVLERANK